MLVFNFLSKKKVKRILGTNIANKKNMQIPKLIHSEINYV